MLFKGIRIKTNLNGNRGEKKLMMPRRTNNFCMQAKCKMSCVGTLDTRYHTLDGVVVCSTAD
jgi:hypothetical protein